MLPLIPLQLLLPLFTFCQVVKASSILRILSMYYTSLCKFRTAESTCAINTVICFDNFANDVHLFVLYKNGATLFGMLRSSVHNVDHYVYLASFIFHSCITCKMFYYAMWSSSIALSCKGCKYIYQTFLIVGRNKLQRKRVYSSNVLPRAERALAISLCIHLRCIGLYVVIWFVLFVQSGCVCTPLTDLFSCWCCCYWLLCSALPKCYDLCCSVWLRTYKSIG